MANNWEDRATQAEAALAAAQTRIAELERALLSAIVPIEPWMEGHSDDTRMATARLMTFGEHRHAHSLLAKDTTAPDAVAEGQAPADLLAEMAKHPGWRLYRRVSREGEWVWCVEDWSPLSDLYATGPTPADALRAAIEREGAKNG